MENQLQTTKGAYLTDLQQLDGETLRNFVDPKHQASPQELQTLLAIVKNRNLNPFTKEVYFIKYGNNPAQIVVSKDAFMKRAEQNQNYDGFESGVIYEDEKGELKTKKGVILPRKATLIGGWCEVYRKDRSRPVYREVELSAYNTHKNWWQKAPGQMIEKVAIVAAVRDAFSENVGGLYTADEMEQAAPIDVTPRETQEDVKARKMAQIEQQRQEQTQPVQPVQPEQELVEEGEATEEQPQPNFISDEQHDTIMQQINELALITGQATETVGNYYMKKYKLNDFHELLVAGFNVVSNDIQTQINNRKG
jgi:phage recombination protein bet|nr:MAG TPA: RecT protein [Caudoviricetes sp.]